MTLNDGISTHRVVLDRAPGPGPSLRRTTDRRRRPPPADCKDYPAPGLRGTGKSTGNCPYNHAVMCGRYTLVNLAQLTQLFPWITETPADLPARYNIAPTQPILAVANDKPDQYDYFLWGLIPPWAKDPAIGSKMINARCETLAQSNAFKNAYKRRRCLVPADGFYEWKKNLDGKTKQPMYVRLKDGRPFALARSEERRVGKECRA